MRGTEQSDEPGSEPGVNEIAGRKEITRLVLKDPDEYLTASPAGERDPLVGRVW